MLASNYFAFQVELFDDEYKANHPHQADSSPSTSAPLTWESLDKDNAQPAFSVEVEFRFDVLFDLPKEADSFLPIHDQFSLIRDKSPPFFIYV